MSAIAERKAKGAPPPAAEWRKVRLGEICSKIGSGATPRGGAQVYIDSGVSLIRSQNVYNSFFKYEGLSHISEESANKLKNVTVKPNDILLNITGDSVARCCIVPDEILPARVNQHVAIVRPNIQEVLPEYLQRVMVAPYMQAFMVGLASSQGGSRNALTKGNIEEFEILLPPLPVQRRIAEILGAYDDLIENNRRRIALLENMARELYRERFVRRAGGGRQKIRLGEFLTFTRGVGYSSKDIKSGENVLLSMNNIRPYGGFIRDYSRSFCGRFSEAQKVEAGDLIMAITDMTQDRRIIGYTGIVPTGRKNRIICTHLMKVFSERCDNLFLNGMFNYSGLSKVISEHATGATVLGLTADILKDIQCELPAIKEQNRYVAEVEPIIRLSDNLANQCDCLARQRDALLPRLMRPGEGR